MSSQVTERNAATIIAALEEGDETLAELQRLTGLGEHEAERAVNYLKAQRRIENREGLLHLRPAVTAESSDAPPETDAPAPGESVIATPPETPETLVFEGWTLYMTYSHLLPPLTPEEYADLKADIEQHGMMVPVLLSQTGQDRHYHVLDGQHRLRIAAELGLKWMDFPKTYRNLLTPEEREELALNLNLHRRHLTPEQRRDWALKFRQQGMSYRAIGDKLGVDKETVRADVKAATVENSTVELPDRVTGLDGKERPATQPKPAPADDPHNPEADKASLRILLGLADGGTLHRMVLVRQALDAGLTNRQVMGALHSLIESGEVRMDGLICVLVPAESETPPTAPTALDPRATIRVLLAGKPVTRADLWRQFGLQDPKVDYAHHLREMALAGEVIIEASEGGALYSLATAVPAADSSAPGEMIPDSAELELKIVEALRGESMNYHRLLRQTTGLTAILNSDHAHQDNAIRAALNKLAAEQRVHKDDAHLWHLAEEPASPGETTADPTPTSADTNLALLDRAAFEKGLLDLCDQIPGAMRIQGIRSWAALDPEALRTTRALIARTLRAQNDLRVYLTLMDTRLEYMIEHREPYPDPVATPQESPLAQ